MVNLRAIANGVTRAINPNVVCERWRNTGYTTADSGKRTPDWSKAPINVQVQALTYDDLKQLDGLNIQGVRRKIFTNTQVASVIRAAEKGGDLLVFPAGVLPEGTTWLCVQVLERWPDWCTFVITLQDDNYEAFRC
jgi:hypothetical protein